MLGRTPRGRPIDEHTPLPTARPEGATPDYEGAPLERGAYVTAIIHLYRGEVARANAWRLRLDQTTNWALFVTASALGFAFGDAGASHFSLQFANILLLIMLVLEARRFRFFDVWRARIRKIETNFFAPILHRDLNSPEGGWAAQVAADLADPRFHLTRLQALRQRLVRNYLAIFGVVLFGWIIKLDIHPTKARTWDQILDRLAVGPVPAWVILTVLGLFYGGLAAVLILGRSDASRATWGIGELVGEEARTEIHEA